MEFGNNVRVSDCSLERFLERSLAIYVRGESRTSSANDHRCRKHTTRKGCQEREGEEVIPTVFLVGGTLRALSFLDYLFFPCLRRGRGYLLCVARAQCYELAWIIPKHCLKA